MAEAKVKELGLEPFDCPPFSNPDPACVTLPPQHLSLSPRVFGASSFRVLPATLTLKSVARSTAGILGYVIVGDMIYLSGAGPQNAAGDFVLGKLGRDLDVYAPLLRSRRLLLPRSVPSIPAPSG